MSLRSSYSLRILPTAHSPNGFEGVYKPRMVSWSRLNGCDLQSGVVAAEQVNNSRLTQMTPLDSTARRPSHLR
jgi:hypothetical protein